MPTITAVTPATGPTAGGTQITITGTGFGTATGTVPPPTPTVAFGTTAASSVTWISDTSLLATSPAQAAGQIDVTVTASGSASATVTADQFTYVPSIAALAAAVAAAQTTGAPTVAQQQAYVAALQALIAAVDAGNTGTGPYANDPTLQTASSGLATTESQNIAALNTLIGMSGISSADKTAAQNQLTTAEGALPADQQAALTADAGLLAYETVAPAATTATLKNYQITVPNFQELPGSGGGVTQCVATVTAATGAPATYMATPTLTNAVSFLRLGSAPSADEVAASPGTFQNSVRLANLVGHASAILATQNIVVDPTSGKITSDNYNDANTSTLGPSGLTYFDDAFHDGTGVTESAYGSNQDPNFLLGFADDVRCRGTSPTNPANTRISNVTVPNTNQNRQTETLKLLTKGGWWDHSDGNRITTTAGDKIEVIQGNYKVVVLGRQEVDDPPDPPVNMNNVLQACPSLPGPLAAWDGVVGSATYAAASTPWNAATWDTTQWGAKPSLSDIRNQSAYNAFISSYTFTTDHSGGHFQEQYPSPTPCIKTIEYVQDSDGEWTLYQDNGLGNLITKLKGRTVDLFQGSRREAYVGSSASPLDPSLDPELIAKTWARKVYSQTGAPDKPIGAGAPPSGKPDSMPGSSGDLNDGDVFSVTWAQRIMSYTGSSGTPVPYVYSETHAGAVRTATFAGSMHEETTVGPTKYIKNTNSAGVQEIYMGGHVGAYLGGDLTFKLAVAMDIYAGIKVGLTVGAMTDIALGQKLECAAGGKYSWGTMTDHGSLSDNRTSLQTTIAALKVSLGLAPALTAPQVAAGVIVAFLGIGAAVIAGSAAANS